MVKTRSNLFLHLNQNNLFLETRQFYFPKYFKSLKIRVHRTVGSKKSEPWFSKKISCFRNQFLKWTFWPIKFLTLGKLVLWCPNASKSSIQVISLHFLYLTPNKTELNFSDQIWSISWLEFESHTYNIRWSSIRLAYLNAKLAKYNNFKLIGQIKEKKIDTHLWSQVPPIRLQLSVLAKSPAERCQIFN